MRFTEELQRFVRDRTTPSTIEKSRSKGVAMHAQMAFPYATRIPKSIKWTWVESEMNTKIKWELNFALDIESHRFLDA